MDICTCTYKLGVKWAAGTGLMGMYIHICARIHVYGYMYVNILIVMCEMGYWDRCDGCIHTYLRTYTCIWIYVHLHTVRCEMGLLGPV